MSWTKERKDALLALIKDGLSFTQVAMRISAMPDPSGKRLPGVTRNACIGMHGRLQIEAGVHVRVPRGTSVPREPRPKAPRALAVVKPARVSRAPVAPRFVEGRTVSGDTLGCQHMAGDPLIDPTMCGAPRAIVAGFEGRDKVSSFCPTHHALCWRPAPARPEPKPMHSARVAR
ncbi:hypothetical protein sos41_11600 [Alphaproteobacteria bacterium SO-S41]|nr:hypothetical protein sos41_11600 [Alphaproteobacteria bacterium SO-S41]